MWIAKPVHLLAPDEISLWKQIEVKLPLSQTLGWAKAMESLSIKAFLILNPLERVGGIVFDSSIHSTLEHHYECINGPLIHWDNPKLAPRHFAAFAMAVSKLQRGFKSLTIKPRWEPHSTLQRLQNLPIPLFRKSHAATWVISLSKTADEQFHSFSRRMKRTLKLAKKHQIQTQCRQASQDEIQNFVQSMSKFAETHGFSIPPVPWFQAMNQVHELWLVTSNFINPVGAFSQAEILVCRHGTKAHYLFGHRSQSENTPSSISTSAAAQWEAIQKCLERGIHQYDMNGYLMTSDSQNPYYGVCQFKKQFSGTLIEYDIPEFHIT